jgi:predicted Mrr-cat superfamily restriction endonuclease
MNKQAFIIRCSPSYKSRVNEMIENKQIVIGWSETKDKLFEPKIGREKFKEILRVAYPAYNTEPYSLGQGVGYLWRFIREMQIEDYALVPTSKAFYLGVIKSDLIYLPDKIEEDTAIRRNVEWLNGGNPILRAYCGAGLVARLKYQGTCVGASDLISEIEEALKYSISKKVPSFKNQLNEELKEKTSKYLVSNAAILDDLKFEKLICQLMIGFGANTSTIPPKTRYKSSIADIDIIADFVHLGIKIYIQVKKHKSTSDDFAVKQVIEAMKIDNPDGSKPIFGWAVSSGKFNDEAEKMANDNGIRIVNGDDIAEMILSVGLEVFNN